MIAKNSKDGTLKKSEIIMKKCESSIKILTLDNELYPSEVKILNDSPILLYYSGHIKKNSMGVAIVGSRICSDYGKDVTKKTAEILSMNSISIISGMAKGIDGYAHAACINSGGYTMAFLGCGIDIAYPKEHVKLMKKIEETGVVISEYPPGTEPDAKNLQVRVE